MGNERLDHRNAGLLPYLRELHRRLEQYDSYAVFDLTLHDVCEGNLHTVERCKSVIARAIQPQTRSSNYPRVWVEEAIERIDPTFGREENACVQIETESDAVRLFGYGSPTHMSYRGFMSTKPKT